MEDRNRLLEEMNEIVAAEPALQAQLQSSLEQVRAGEGNISAGTISNSMGITIGHNNRVLQIIKNYPGIISDDLLLRVLTVLEQIEQAQSGNKFPPVAPSWPKGKSPFPGLRAFGPKDDLIFFGRGLETEHLLKRLSSPKCRFLVVVGASGSGKSSLVSAGLLPRLQAGALPGSESWPVLRFSPDALGDGDPFTALAGALREAPFHLHPRELRQQMHKTHTALRASLEEHLAGQPDPVQTLLFIDQFEELFTSITPERRLPFLELVAEATNSPRILTIVTVRDDFFHFFAKFPLLSRLINDNDNSTYTLSAPSLVELYEMITGPARVAGLQFENGLVSKILADTGREPGALALMAYALDQLHKASRNVDSMNVMEYDSFGGVQGAIGTRAGEVFAQLSTEAQTTLPQVFRELLEVDESGKATRKRASRERVEYNLYSRELVEKFREARLLVSSEGLVEVAHEALFRSWPRLKAWIEETQDAHIVRKQVHAAAAAWEKSGFNPDYLWLDERLQPVYEMQRQLEPDLDEVTLKFIRLEAERLLEQLEDPDTPHEGRLDIGKRLNKLGNPRRDPRPGVGLVHGILPLQAEEGKPPTFNALRPGEIRLWGDKPEHVGLPDIVWCHVEGGSIKIENQTFKVHPFYIARYPITYKQFEVFVEAEDGFHVEHWWKDLSAYKDDNSKPDEQNFKFDNHTRENVSWYDAIAFCRWLNARLGWSELPANLTIKTLEDFKGIRLPVEWEWQWAATGGDTTYEYPWGKEWDGSKVNTYESGLGRTTAVGMYLAGSAKCGALDLSGNVFEWCLNEYDKLENVGLSGTGYRVVRGGSWNHDRGRARASYRSHLFGPGYRTSDYGGFRLVVRPPSL